MPKRDPRTGELLHTLSVHIHVKGEAMPRMYDVADWAALRRFLASPDFKAIAGRVENLSITNHATE